MTDARPLVSVLMTAFNRERYIASAIESVLTQTLDDFELVVVDDASTDRTVGIARDYAAVDRRIRVIVNERNRGDYPNRNHAASFAAGRYLKYHDSDDIMYSHCLRTMVTALECEPLAAAALSEHRAWAGGPCPMLSTPRMSYEREFLGYGLFMCGPACALFRREAFLRIGRFPEQGPHSDYLFWLNFCRTEAVLLLPADLFWYRIHAGQHLQSGGAAWDTVPLGLPAWTSLRDPGCPLDLNQREQARRNQAFTVAKRAWRDLRAGAVRRAAVRMRESGLTAREWLTYLRWPVRSGGAGVPLECDGEFVVPRLRGPHGCRRPTESPVSSNVHDRATTVVPGAVS